MADGSWRVSVSAPAEDGKANAAVIDALAKEFDVPKGAVKIVRGMTGRQKEVEITSSCC